MNCFVVLDNLRSVHNVGSIFRTANAVGVKKIYLCGTTPTPLDNLGLKRKDFAKVSLGAEDTVAWEYVASTFECVKKLKSEQCFIVSLEQDGKSVDYKTVDTKGVENVVLVVGNEVDGVGEEVLLESDVIMEIPMMGSKESLNVTIAFGIAVYRLLGI